MLYYETDYLAHHGVKGMRWGQRKQRIKKGVRRGAAGVKNTAQRAKAYGQTNLAKRNRARHIGQLVGFAGGIGGAYAANRALSKISNDSAVQIAGTAAAGMGAYFVASRITRGIANSAQGSTYRQMRKRGQASKLNVEGVRYRSYDLNGVK